MDHWGTQFAREIRHRGDGQSNYALDLIDLLSQKAEDFNRESSKGFKNVIAVTAKGEDVDVSNGYKTVSIISSMLPGIIFVRVQSDFSAGTFEATLANSPDGFIPDGVPGECSDPEGLAEWMIHELFEP